MNSPTLARHGAGAAPVLVWRFPRPCRTIASAVMGGGVGAHEWIVNAQVPKNYARTDLDTHLRDIAQEQGCVGNGIGFLTAAKVEQFTHADDRGVDAYATVGLSAPTWAADVDDAISPYRVGTINIVTFVPAHLDDSALVNSVVTATEAKTQALFDAGVPGTGTASDAIAIVCTDDSRTEQFAGPRSPLGASIARAVHRAVGAGCKGVS